jgi:2-hydroxy-6-oxonona-2,4-dienedioate hydrolase
MPGTPGPGFFQPSDWLESGFGIISVSRPGYARTPLSSGETAEDQADLIMALLDFLDIEKVGVAAYSGSGPVGL